MADANDKIAAASGATRATVDRILDAQLTLLIALGIAHGDEDDAARGAKLRTKYPELLRRSVVETAGRTSETPLTHELEATIVQLETGESARTVVDVIAAHLDVMQLIDSKAYAEYRDWAAKWVGDG
jgi:hypothetical protein